MKLFGKKEDNEPVKKAEVPTPAEQSVSTPDVENKVEPEAPPETPEQKREKESKKLLITVYLDGQLKIEAIQNITHRAEAEFVVSRAKEEYERNNIANLTALIVMQTLAKSHKGKDIWVPGSKQ
jgi:hypothetical protein